MHEVKRIFNINDQIAFAEISGDYNPVHLDKLIARRSIFGEVIVHGMHLVLWALNEQLNKKDYKYLSKIKVDFLDSIFLENEIKFIWEDNFKINIGNIFVNKKGINYSNILVDSSKNNITPINICPPKELSRDINMKKFLNEKETLSLFFPKDKINNMFS